MYCTVTDFRRLLPPSVTVGDSNLGTPSPGRPTTKRDTISVSDAERFIQYGSQEVDSRLRPLYVCPLRRIKTYETEVLNVISSGNNIVVNVHDSGAFYSADMVRLQDGTGYENCTINAVPSLTKIQLVNVTRAYNPDNTIISILEYPDPIPMITARLAVSYGFDQMFTADQAPDISSYGKEQRKLAFNSMDSILLGAVLLPGQEHTGRRFVRMSLLDAFKSPAQDIQFGRESQ